MDKILFSVLRRTLQASNFFVLLLVPFPELFRLFAEIGWNILLVTLFLGPICTLFPKIRIFGFLRGLRRELGILAGVFLIAHGIGFFLQNAIGPEVLLNAFYWDPRQMMLWGILGAIAAIPPLVTSNAYSQKILKGKWIWFQFPVYFFFLFGSFHIALGNKDPTPLIFVGVWGVLKIMAIGKRILFRLPRPLKKKKISK